MKAACAATKALNAQTGAYVAPTMPAPMPTAAHVEAAPVAPAHVEAAPVAPATMPAAPAAH